MKKEIESIIVENPREYPKFNDGGREGILYSYDRETLMKIYDNPSVEILQTIKTLYLLQEKIKGTDFPFKTVFDKNGNFIGILIKQYKKTQSMEILFNNSSKFAIAYYLYQLVSDLEELTNNYIYLEDIFMDNVLIDNETDLVHIIDIGGLDTHIGKNIKSFQNVLRLLTFMIIDLFAERDLEKYLEYETDLEYYKEVTGFPNSLLIQFENEGYSYVFIKQLINYYLYFPYICKDTTKIKKTIYKHLDKEL